MLCGSPKQQPRTSSIVQFIFFFWSFEISRNILRNLNFYMFRPMYSKQVFDILTPFRSISAFLLAALLKLEIIVSFLWLSLQVHSGSLRRIKYSKLYSLAHTLLLNVFSALKGTHFYILFVVTAAGVVLCGNPKKQPRTSTIVQFIFFFWSFEIRGNILKKLNFYMLRPMYSKQFFDILTPFRSISAFLFPALLKLEITVSFLWLSLPVHLGSLRRI